MIRNRWARVVVGLLIAVFAQAQETKAKSGDAVHYIVARNLIDGRSDQVQHNKLIVIQGNRITEVRDGGITGANLDVITLPETVTVMPGMIESHTHIFLQ